MGETIYLAVTGESGDPGKSAYQAWLDAGNSGEVSDFLLSLKGQPGENGKSAYQIWLELGNTGTPQQFIDSLKGAKGDPGTGSSGGSGYTPLQFFFNPSGYILGDIPAAERDFPNSIRPLDLTGKTQARLSTTLQSGGGSTSELRIKYSTDNGTNWAFLDGNAGPAVSLNGAGAKVSAKANIATAAKADVLVKLVTIGGDGIADPNFRYIGLETW